MSDGQVSKVYIVECGEYSGRYIAGVFIDHDIASAFARAHGGDASEYEIDTDLDEASKRQYRPGGRLYWVTMAGDGNHAKADETFTEKSVGVMKIRPGLDRPERVTCIVWAQDEEHAIKMVNERRSAWLAGPRGLGKDLGYGWHEVTT